MHHSINALSLCALNCSSDTTLAYWILRDAQLRIQSDLASIDRTAPDHTTAQRVVLSGAYNTLQHAIDSLFIIVHKEE